MFVLNTEIRSPSFDIYREFLCFSEDPYLLFGIVIPFKPEEP